MVSYGEALTWPWLATRQPNAFGTGANLFGVSVTACLLGDDWMTDNKMLAATAVDPARTVFTPTCHHTDGTNSRAAHGYLWARTPGSHVLRHILETVHALGLPEFLRGEHTTATATSRRCRHNRCGVTVAGTLAPRPVLMVTSRWCGASPARRCAQRLSQHRAASRSGCHARLGGLCWSFRRLPSRTLQCQQRCTPPARRRLLGS